MRLPPAQARRPHPASAALLLAALALLPARPERVGADDGERSGPVATSGLPVEGGWIFPHYGLTRPPADRGEPWRLERTGSRLVNGRRLDEVRYVRGGQDGAPLTWAAGFDEVALVDPHTGEVVGGLSGGEAAAAADPPVGCGEGR